MVPAVTSIVTPVMLFARSDARNTAVLAMSSMDGSFFNIVSFSMPRTIRPISSGYRSIASRNTRESGEPADRMFTTRTPYVPSSDARFRENDSMAAQAGRKTGRVWISDPAGRRRDR